MQEIYDVKQYLEQAVYNGFVMDSISPRGITLVMQTLKEQGVS